MERSRAWTFTLNNYTEESEQLLQALDVKYLIYGREVGESGTPHLQGYVSFANPRRFNAIKKTLPVGSHIEAALGNSQQNFDYCTKDNDYFEKGTRPKTAKEGGAMEKKRWDDAMQSAKDGRLDDIPTDIRVRYYRTWKQIKSDYMPPVPDADDTTGIWYYGEAGAGKSRTARADYPDAYLKMCNKWWDGYQDEPYVIIDDIDCKHDCLGHHLKIWADRYAFLAETKGGAIKIRPDKIIVTSQYSPEQIWSDQPTVDAIRRRFKCIHVKKICNSS